MKSELTNEDLRDWFGKGGKGGVGGGGWDRYNSKGERVGKCGDAKEGDVYSACLSKEKAQKLGKEGIASFVNRKRAAQKKKGDAKKGREHKKGQKPIKVKTGVNESVKYSQLEERLNLFLEKNTPTDPSKWSYYKSQAKKKFDVYPSAYANAWAAKMYKKAGGGWRKGKKKNESNEEILLRNKIREILNEEYFNNEELDELYPMLVGEENVEEGLGKYLAGAALGLGLALGSPGKAMSQDVSKNDFNKPNIEKTLEKDFDKLSFDDLMKKVGTVEERIQNIDGKQVTTYIAYAYADSPDISFVEKIANQNARILLSKKLNISTLKSSYSVGERKFFDDSNNKYRHFVAMQITM